MDFCRNEETDYEDVVEGIESSDYVFGDLIYDDISTFDGSWDDLRDALDEVNSGYYWYRIDGRFDYVPMDDYDFENAKGNLLERLIDDDYFDDDEEVVNVDEVDPEIFHEQPVINENARFPWQRYQQAEEPEMEVLSVDGISALSEMVIGEVNSGDVAWDDVSRMC